jgi:peptidoglycan/xylan/chitin deacetylase (PgdA/CDA1 family)
MFPDNITPQNIVMATMASTGLDRVLRTLKNTISNDLFIPGKVAENYPGSHRKDRGRQHELAVHGLPIRAAPFDGDQQVEEMGKAKEILKNSAQVPVVFGHRKANSPWKLKNSQQMRISIFKLT